MSHTCKLLQPIHSLNWLQASLNDNDRHHDPIKRLFSADGRKVSEFSFMLLESMLGCMNKHLCVKPTLIRRYRTYVVSSSVKRSAGFTLIEILISIILLSFGLLGMVGLQAAALQANRDARIQSSAVRLARELGELMRSNKDVGIATSNNPYLIDWNNSTASPATIPAATTNCLTADCSSATKIQLAEFDVRDWLNRLKTELPGARVLVCFDSTPFDASGIPQWNCSNSGGIAVIKIGWTKTSTNRASTGAAALQKATVPSVVLPVTAGSNT